MRKQRTGYILIAPLILGYLLFFAIPFVQVIRFSFLSGVGRNAAFAGLENYQGVLENDSFQKAIGNTLIFLAIGLPVILALSYVIALLMKTHAEKHKLLKSVFLLPYIMPVVGTVLLVDLLFSQTGLVNRLLEALGLAPGEWLSGGTAFVTLILLYLWKNTGYAVILLLAGLVTIPEEQYESADLDGADVWQKFRYITTPQMWYSVFFTTIFSVINAFKCFREIFLIGGVHPSDNLYMLQHFLNNSFENLNYGKLSVASTLLLILILVFFTSFYAFVKRKEV